jgi:hypothetical protein
MPPYQREADQHKSLELRNLVCLRAQKAEKRGVTMAFSYHCVSISYHWCSQSRRSKGSLDHPVRRAGTVAPI